MNNKSCGTCISRISGRCINLNSPYYPSDRRAEDTACKEHIGHEELLRMVVTPYELIKK